MSEPIELDLRRDLPKVREAYGDLADKVGACFYSAPCAVGAMMTPEQRERLVKQSEDETRVSLLIGNLIEVPGGQEEDFSLLQRAFDGGLILVFDEALTRLESKYLGQPS